MRETVYSEKISFLAQFVAINQDIYFWEAYNKSWGWKEYIDDDNILAVHNTSKLESILKNESNSICYHAVCKLVTVGKSTVDHISSSENVAHLITKVSHTWKRQILVTLFVCFQWWPLYSVCLRWQNPDKLNPIGNSIKNEGAMKIESC